VNTASNRSQESNALKLIVINYLNGNNKAAYKMLLEKLRSEIHKSK